MSLIQWQWGWGEGEQEWRLPTIGVHVADLALRNRSEATQGFDIAGHFLPLSPPVNDQARNQLKNDLATLLVRNGGAATLSRFQFQSVGLTNDEQVRKFLAAN